MNNPFNISFGIKPQHFISRLSQTNGILDTFRSEHPSSQLYVLTGVRGSGKTVMMSTISDALSKESGWVTVEINPEKDHVSMLAASLYSMNQLHPLFVKAKFNLSALGLGVSIEDVPPITDPEIALDRMLAQIKKANKRVLVTIDEVTNNRFMREFAAAYQIFIRKEYPIFLLMTGLYENIYQLQNEKTLTFMYRAPKVVLEPLNMTSIRSHYQKVFNITNDQAGQMANLTKGYSYAFQVLGYLAWENRDMDIDDLMPLYDQYLEEYVYGKIWSELSETDQAVIAEMVKTGETSVTSIRESLKMSTSQFSVYRDRLKRKGLINAPSYGHISILLPRFEEFVCNHM